MELRLDLREVLHVLGRRPQFVLAQVTTFTVAHSITLGLGIFVTALVTFNLGVEIGQLSVIAAAFLLVGYWYSERVWYRRRIVVPASVAIALTALIWTIQRTLG